MRKTPFGVFLCCSDVFFNLYVAQKLNIWSINLPTKGKQGRHADRCDIVGGTSAPICTNVKSG